MEITDMHGNPPASGQEMRDGRIILHSIPVDQDGVPLVEQLARIEGKLDRLLAGAFLTQR